MNAAEQILHALRSAQGSEVSSRTICERLGVSRAAVWKQIEALRTGGYAIEACSRRGYRLVAAPDTPHAPEVVPLLTTRRLGRDFRYAPETGSTNRDAAARAEAGAPEGAVVAAGEQTAGRGRMTREWFSPPGANLYFSIVLRPNAEPGKAATLPLVMGLAVAEALASFAPETQPLIKWPNDILIGGRKLCGILCEMQAEADCVRHLIAGVGVNLNLARQNLPAALKDRATSLRIETGRSYSRAEALAGILNRFEPLYDAWLAEGLTPLLDAIAARDALQGKTISLEYGGRRIRGLAEGIQPDGALRLVTDQGPVPIYSGEAHVVGTFV